MLIRFRTPQGMKRVELGDSATFGDLRAALEREVGIKPQDQLISTTPTHQPQIIEAPNQKSLADLGVRHGQMLHLIVPAGWTSSDKQATTSSSSSNGTKQAKAFSTRTPRSTTLATSAYVNDPEARKKDQGPTFMPYQQWVLKRQKENANQPWNIDRTFPKFTPAKHSGHIAFKDMPENAVLRLQKFRHVDGISFQDPQCGEVFTRKWQTAPEKQRAAIMFGTYIPEPTKVDKVEGAIRAQVVALYEPPQRGKGDGVKILSDPNEDNVLEMADALGLEPIGWIITTLPRGGKQYKGDLLMSGAEIIQAARFQWRFRNIRDNSRFVTMVLGFNKQGEIEPQSYQVSDECVALVRDGLLEAGSGVGFVQPCHAPGKDIYMPAIISENKRVSPGDDFLPDAMLVPVRSSQPYHPKHKFRFIHFPSDGGPDKFRGHLQHHRGKTAHVMFSDFNLLLALPNFIGLDLARKVAEAVASETALDAATQRLLDAKLAPFR